MKVLYVLKRYPRLSETFVVREIAGVESRGVTVLVDALMPPADEPRHPEVAGVRARVRYLPRSPRPARDGVLRAGARLVARRPAAVAREVSAARARARAGDRRAWRHLRLALLVAARARAESVTHVHAHFATAAAEVAVPAARLAGLPVTVTAHAKDVFHAENRDRLADRLSGTSAVVTVSDHNVRHLRSTLGPCLGPTAPPVHHVPNGVPLGRVNLRAVGAPEAPVLCVARLVPKKGVDVLLAAVATASTTDPRTRLEVIGTGPCEEALREQAARLGITDRVDFLGARTSTEVEAAYARSSLVALPCRIDDDGDRDGLPTVLVEALARGIPVVSTTVAGIPELVLHGRTGLLVPPDDPEALARALVRLRRDPDLATELGRTGRALVAEAYAPTCATSRLLEVWSGVGA